MKMIAKVELTTDRAIRYANENFSSVTNENIMILEKKYNNKKTTKESYTRYVKQFLNFYENFKRQYRILSVEIIEE